MAIEPSEIYADGGVIGKNPSSHGGTWCFLWAGGGGEVLRLHSGLVTPADLGVARVTNNHTELLAALKALESVPRGWAGTLYTDSVVTLHRVTSGSKFDGVPQWLRLRVLEVRRARRYRVMHVKGHTTEEQRINGVGHTLNVMCDRECSRLARVLLRERGGEPGG